MIVIDLGLSVNWAECNLGANSPLDCGNYYSWGEIHPKSKFTETSNRFYSGALDFLPIDDIDSDYYNIDYRNNNMYIKYNSKDGKRVLEMEDDAAQTFLGNCWKIPNQEDWQELVDCCDWIWLENQKGYQIISRKNGNSILLPITGYYFLDVFEIFWGLENDLKDDQIGFYWTSQLHLSKHLQFKNSFSIYTNAITFSFNKTCLHFKEMNRAVGVPIRPVQVPLH